MSTKTLFAFAMGISVIIHPYLNICINCFAASEREVVKAVAMRVTNETLEIVTKDVIPTPAPQQAVNKMFNAIKYLPINFSSFFADLI